MVIAPPDFNSNKVGLEEVEVALHHRISPKRTANNLVHTYLFEPGPSHIARLHQWTQVGLTKVGDLWDHGKGDWVSWKWLIEHAPKPSLRDQWQTSRVHILTHIPWELRQIPSLQKGNWIGHLPPEGPRQFFT